jgi:hypothetical protein
MKDVMCFKKAFWGFGAPYGAIFFLLTACSLLVCTLNFSQFYKTDEGFMGYFFVGNEVNYQLILICSFSFSTLVCFLVTYWKMKIRPVSKDYLVL